MVAALWQTLIDGGSFPLEARFVLAPRRTLHSVGNDNPRWLVLVLMCAGFFLSFDRKSNTLDTTTPPKISTMKQWVRLVCSGKPQASASGTTP